MQMFCVSWAKRIDTLLTDGFFIQVQNHTVLLRSGEFVNFREGTH